MSVEPENLIPVYLRRIEANMDRVIDDMQDLKHRVTSREGNAARLTADVAGGHADDAGLRVRLDRIESRLERRVVLQDASV